MGASHGIAVSADRPRTDPVTGPRADPLTAPGADPVTGPVAAAIPVPCTGGERTVIPLDTRRLFRAEFPALPDRAAAVRRMVAGHLRDWRLGTIVDHVVLATNELFANAVEHGSSGPADTVTITVSLERFGRELRVEVADGSPVIPVARKPEPTEESGRGLAIVEDLALDWGTEPPDPGVRGKKVWFTLPLVATS
ncbi:anti-sigma factor [Streptomyces violaceusniger]|uniref:Anti-sigma factor n=1 Tax=Streptomyces violaceusniger TaxID=68280 RepID=A0A0X3W175_STRVO|nr:anti-sigma factor [Streptomyces violaceusniger]RSS36261.1 ATP-binding protein [Streptomyces sp. WAC05858]